MLGILKRLFVKLPLFIISIIISVTMIVPIFYWVITGNNWFNLVEETLDYVDNI